MECSIPVEVVDEESEQAHCKCSRANEDDQGCSVSGRKPGLSWIYSVDDDLSPQPDPAFIVYEVRKFLVRRCPLHLDVHARVLGHGRFQRLEDNGPASVFTIGHSSDH